MKKLPRVAAREVESALLRAGFQYSHARGSHRSYIKEGKRVIIPFHGSRIIPPGTLRNILRQAGLSPEDFEKIVVVAAASSVLGRIAGPEEVMNGS